MLPLLEPGVVLAGKYRVERVLGQGGMGVVLAAQHLQLGQRVALKFLLPEVCTNGEAVARFLREARTAVQIESEHVARVVDVGTLEGGAPYMVMEYLEGSDLGDVLAKRGPMPLPLAAGYVLEAMEAIAEAHALGMVHRDLKPSNLFLARRRDGSNIVKVLDFGISKAAHDAQLGPSASMTSTTAVMGSPLYMSPEQVRSSKDVDARADVWSLGVILHELLSGRTPFHGETMTAVLAMIVADPPPPLRTVRPDLSPAVEAIVFRCLNKDRTQRFQNVAELAYALAPYAPPEAQAAVERISKVLGRPPMASVPNLAQSSAAVSSQQTGNAWGNTQMGEPKSKKALLFGGIAAVLVAGAAAGAFLFNAPSADTAASASAASPNTAAAAPAVPEAAETAATAKTPPEPVVTPAAPIVVEPSAAPVVEPPPAPAARSTRTSRPSRRSSPATTAAVVGATTREASTPPSPPAAPKPAKGLFDDTK
jgi:serine/threonine-protein kinase